MDPSRHSVRAFRSIGCSAHGSRPGGMAVAAPEQEEAETLAVMDPPYLVLTLALALALALALLLLVPLLVLV